MRFHSRGYTLIELLLVLALVVIAAAVVAPVVMDGGDRSEVEDAAQELATMWGRARLDAVSAGQVLMFQGELGGSIGRVQDAAAAMGEETVEGQPPTPKQELQLENVVLRSLTLAEPAGGDPVRYEVGSASVAPMVVFRPDGAASDAEAILQHDSGLQMKVVLRGLTGAVRVEEVSTE